MRKEITITISRTLPYLDPVTVGTLRLAPRSGQVTTPTRESKLTPTQTMVLHFLMERPGVAFRDIEIVRSLWEDEFPRGTHHAVRQHIRAIRVKIEDDPSSPRYLLTLPLFGYMIAEATEPHPAQSHVVEAPDPLA